MKKYLLSLGIVGLFLLIVPSAYAALITSGDVSAEITGASDTVSTRVMILVFANYLLILLGVLNLVFVVTYIVKIFKSKGKPKSGNKYFGNFSIFVLALIFLFFGIQAFSYYLLILLVVLNLVFIFVHLVKIYRAVDNPDNGNRYSRSLLYFVFAFIVVLFGLLIINQTMCAAPPGADYDCGGFNIRLTF
ncbi:hypothetical protein HOG17_05490 [Candidatus Peregrinibacteria bacterium]|jgi:hypothetical protein|nr:hypothetical protein [Candidatus Peregrinibacteria bacterium]MBT4148144.1 hypothetical protein [Candidatus Peregrinibacteria bacterium]MBT4366631.1 hypothetical protein [Candidatus Peregrinibacteria bacterium]MBT4455618.1 hypothetical protein [Candidatus Peregrinibacteria bacterium]